MAITLARDCHYYSTLKRWIPGNLHIVNRDNILVSNKQLQQSNTMLLIICMTNVLRWSYKVANSPNFMAILQPVQLQLYSVFPRDAGWAEHLLSTTSGWQKLHLKLGQKCVTTFLFASHSKSSLPVRNSTLFLSTPLLSPSPLILPFQLPTIDDQSISQLP